MYTWTALERFKGGFTGSEFGTVDADGSPVIPASVEHVYTFAEVLPVAGYTSQMGLYGWSVANTRLARAGDYVWVDKNRNGIQDDGEPGVAGVRVTIAGDNLPEGYQATQLTDANGHYLFSDLPPGAYTITFDTDTLPAYYIPALTGADGATAANDSNGLVSTVTLTTEDDLTCDLGIERAPVVTEAPPTDTPTPEITETPPVDTAAPEVTQAAVVTVAPPPPPPAYEPISVPLAATKELSGKPLAADAFTFELLDGAGKTIQEATNAADGSITFADRRFSRTGRFLYTIREKVGAAEGITYDRTAYRVTVDVTASGNALSAAVTIRRDGMPYAGPVVFRNAARLPATGDTAWQGPLRLLALGMLTLGAGLILRRKRRADR